MAQGNGAPRVVAVVPRDPSLAEVIEAALSDEGYRVQRYALGPDTAHRIAQAQPDALVVESGRGPDALALLDALRVVEAGNRIAVVTLGSTPRAQEQAQASGNVHAALPAPFDLDDLLAAVAGALAGRPAEARLLAQPLEPAPAYRQAADLLARAERAIMLGWLQRIRGVEPFAERPDISPRDFLDNVPRILNLVVLGLRHQEAPGVLDRDDEVRRRIRAHAALRQRQGLPIGGLAREYQVLRDSIAGRLRRGLAAEDALAVLDKLNALLDDVARLSVEEYHQRALAG